MLWYRAGSVARLKALRHRRLSHAAIVCGISTRYQAQSFCRRSTNGLSVNGLGDCNLIGAKYLIVSRHDYRSHRRASIHFIARELAKIGETRFFSSSFSYLSYLTHDQRLSLWNRANTVEIYDNIKTYLWKTIVHPCKTNYLLSTVMDTYFKFYANNLPRMFHRWIQDSDYVILESGGPEIFYNIIRKINPNCKIIYISSDTLDVIGTSNYCVKALRQAIPLFDGIRVPSRAMAPHFAKSQNVYFVPHGFDEISMQAVTASPYGGGVNLLSVGDMLFDPRFFEIATRLFPSINFHIIGAGPKALTLKAPNIRLYPEMPFNLTLPFLEHADGGIAPYDADRTPNYLADTSMKLMQYGYFGLPAICPQKIAGEGRHRFGYMHNNPESIFKAIRLALEAGRTNGKKVLNWTEVTKRIIAPKCFDDTKICLN